MASPAARLGDLTLHGSPLGPGPGCLNVQIGGMPAWRAVIDTHGCPLSSPNPHGIGAVTRGSATVLIGGQQAARQGDQILEAGSPAPNAIASGAFNVLIGG